MDNNKTLLLILAFFVPPAAVYMKDGNKITNNFWINVVLWVLTWIGGVIHAFYIVLK